MTGFVLSPAAQADVDEIWDYTAEKWNADQAERYTESIRDACHALAAGKLTGRPVPMRNGYRKTIVGSHILFFRIDESGQIVIIRILHQKMDAGRYI